ncbi:MAG: hypothetical protein DWQ36_15235 [Acidobacteria bacterium]|mgnify:CR=1 FL=1|nr:MAG: hypothetical protein DWQ30_07840 [Acidobacteriota bacterium]REK05861.1 MAG: hypothetical protein DWQ36_15235 [Acidobacteriota bacterium]
MSEKNPPRDRIPPSEAAAPSTPSRRDFLLRAAGASAYAAPLFLSLGASAAEGSAFERARQYLGNARDLISEARGAQGDRRRDLATEAQSELTEARAEARSATPAQQRQLRDPMEAVASDIEELLAD